MKTRKLSVFLRPLFCLALLAGGMAASGMGNATAAAGDGNWQEGFTLNGVSGSIHEILRAPDGSLYVSGQFGSAGGIAAANVARWDGAAWHALGDGIPNSNVYSLALDSSGNLYAGLDYTSDSSDTVVRKWDGAAWTSIGGGPYGYVYALAVDSSGNVCAGGDITLTDGGPQVHLVCFDGTNWTEIPGGPSGSVSALVFDSSDTLYVGGDFDSPGYYIAKWNSTAGWSAISIGVNWAVKTIALAPGGGIYVGGSFTTAGGIDAKHVAKWDGSAWSNVGNGVDSNVVGLTVDGVDLYTVGEYNNKFYASRWDGASSTWQTLAVERLVWEEDEGFFNVEVDGNGVLYLGGDFPAIGGSQLANIARWNGSAWEALSATGNGINGTVRALVSDQQGNLYAGGNFSSAGGVLVNNIAKWDGSAWSALGDGIDGWVSALAIDSQNNLYAGGYFSSVGGNSAEGLAKWNGTSWETVSLGFDHDSEERNIYALAIDSNDNLYVGGKLYGYNYIDTNPGVLMVTSSGAVSVPGGGVNDAVYALALDSNDVLYAGGEFTSTTNGTAVNHIARYEGNNWHPLSSGLNQAVNALAVDSNNQVYAGGDFISPAIYIARWNGTNWSALGSGLNNAANALMISGNRLIAGGYFTAAGGNPAKNIAAWNGTGWSALGSGVDKSVEALANASDGFYAGGYFSTAGGKASVGIARYSTAGKSERRYLPLVGR